MRWTPEKNFQFLVIEANSPHNVTYHNVSIDRSDSTQRMFTQLNIFDEFFLKRTRVGISFAFMLRWRQHITPDNNTSAGCNRNCLMRVFDKNCVTELKADWNSSCWKVSQQFLTLFFLEFWNESFYKSFLIQSKTFTHWPKIIPFLVVTTSIEESDSLQLNRMLWTSSYFSESSKKSMSDQRIKQVWSSHIFEQFSVFVLPLALSSASAAP